MNNPAKSNKPVDGRTARREETRAAILSASTRLFAARGIEATTVDDIATASGSAKGSIYYNFESKAGVVTALLDRIIEDISGTVRRAGEMSVGPAARRAIVAALLDKIGREPDIFRVIIGEIYRSESGFIEPLKRWNPAIIKIVAEHYHHEQCIRGQCACEVKAEALVGATIVVGLDWVNRHPEASFEHILNGILCVVDR